jgi:MFS family permease
LVKRPYPFLFGSTLLLETALNLPMGILPLALASEGVSAGMVTMVMGSGMVCALIMSLPSGALVDRFGHTRVMCWSARLATFVLLGLLVTHGVFWGCLMMGLRSIVMTIWGTAKFAYAGMLFSDARAVSAVTSVGVLGSLALAVGPPLGVLLWQRGLMHEQYVCALLFVLFGMVLIDLLPRPRDVGFVKGGNSMLRASWLPVLAFTVALKMEMGVDFSSAILTFHGRGITNGALLFTSAALVSLLLRYPLGRLVESFGPQRIAAPIACLQAVGCVLAAFADTTSDVLLAGIGLGVGWGGILPVGIGILFEESSPHTRCAAVGAYSFACSLGAMLGAVLSTVAGPTGLGYIGVILICGAAPLLMLPFVTRSRTCFPSAASDAALSRI